MSGARLRRCSLLAALPCLLFSCCPHAKSLTETCCCRPPQHLLLAALRLTRLHGTSLGRSFQDSSPPCLAGAPCPSLPCTLHLASPPLAACASRCALSRPPLDIKAPRLSGVAGAAARARLWLSKRGCCLAGALQHRHLGALLARRRLCAHGPLLQSPRSGRERLEQPLVPDSSTRVGLRAASPSALTRVAIAGPWRPRR